jgi:single-strand DNA-binding protein
MPNFNKVFLMGNLTRDPELRVTPKGTPVCQFGLAVNRVFRTDSGENQEETTFVDVEAWGRQAETISKYVSKGKPLFVEGRLKLDSWESKAGEKRSKIKVGLENLQLISSRGEGGTPSQRPEAHAPQERAAPAASTPAASTPAASTPAAPAADDIEEDVPF